MVVLLDMDGPLADFDGHFWERCLAEGWAFDIDLPSQQAHRFFTEHMPDRAQRKAARRLVDSPGWFEDLPVVDGAAEGIIDLMAAGFDLWVCTKPLEANPTCRDAKGAWLRRHLPDLEHRLIIAPDKSLVMGDYLIDDAPHPAWYDGGRATWAPIIFTAPFNGVGSDWADLPHWTWAEGTDELVHYIRGNQ